MRVRTGGLRRGGRRASRPVDAEGGLKGSFNVGSLCVILRIGRVKTLGVLLERTTPVSQNTQSHWFESILTVEIRLARHGLGFYSR